MKKSLVALVLGLAVAACDVPVEQQETPVANANAATQAEGRPVILNRGLIPKRTAWKDKHFFMPEQDYGSFTYFAFSRLAIAASVDCDVPLDGVYLDLAEAAGRRSLFQNKAAREAKAKAAIDAFNQQYGPFDADDPTRLCRAVARNKADETLFGAFFF